MTTNEYRGFVAWWEWESSDENVLDYDSYTPCEYITDYCIYT